MERVAEKVLLIGWDAADWKMIRPLMDAGWMPTLQHLMQRGVWGNIATLQPMLSPMLWTSVATGKRADKHGICGFTEPDPSGAGVRPVNSTSRRCKAFWNVLSQKGLRTNVIGWYASHPAEPIDGAIVSNAYSSAVGPFGSPWPMRAGSIHPSRLEDAMAEMRVHPAELGQEHLQPFVPDMPSIDQARDKRLATLAKFLARSATNHAAATWLMEQEPWDVTAVFYELTDHLGHVFMPYHPPKMDCVTQHDFDLYQHVMAGCYKYHDMMLHRLLELAGEDATVIILSDHGFHCDAQRPSTTSNPTAWHRRYGILCMAGPGIPRGQRVYGANLLDICPTLLAMLGLPAGMDMDGKMIPGAFDEPARHDRITSWELVADERAPADATPVAAVDTDEAGDAEAIAHLIDLGYIEAPDESDVASAENTAAVSRFNLAISLQDAGRHADSATILRELVEKWPRQLKFRLALVRCFYHAGDIEACRELYPALSDEDAEDSTVQLIQGALAMKEGRPEAALEHFTRGASAADQMPGLHVMLGRAHTRLEQWAQAESAYRRAIDLDGDEASAYDGLSHALLAQSRWAEAADAALTSVELLRAVPSAHFHLGAALTKMNRPREAITAFETCLSMAPQSIRCHSWLERIHREALEDERRAQHHRDEIDRLKDAHRLRQMESRIDTDFDAA
ncbi:MAG: hypothetical protein CMJ18_11670 [Phycisphaeraceae bacterium]|nr:hypothetical protein [Phycisphaeraceae bacterium]